MISNSAPHDAARRTNVQAAAVNAAIAALLVSGILFLHYCRPVLYMGLILEDFWGEYATFVCYLLAFVFLSWTMVKNPHARKPGYFLTAAMMFLIAMDEISWGQRILNIATPRAVAKLNYQSELTIHNIIDNMVSIEPLFFTAVFVWVFLLPFAARLIKPLNAFMARWGIPRAGLEESPYFLIALIFFAFSPVIKSDEISELLLAAAFASWAQTVLFDSPDRFANSKAMNTVKRKLALLLVVALSAGALVSMFGITIPRQRARLKGQLHWTAAISYPKAGLYPQAGELFKHILASESLMRKESLLQYGIFLSQSDNPEAEAVLKRALVKESESEVKNPEDPQYNRNKGIIYKLLKMDAQAHAEFELAMQKDRNRLARVDRDSEKYGPVLSMAKTCVSMENYGLALQHLKEAVRLAPRELEKLMAEDWMHRIADKEALPRGRHPQILQYIYLK